MSLSKYEKDLAELDKQIATLIQTREELQNDLKEAETQAFAGFLKKIGFKDLKEYEGSRSNEAVKAINEQKNNLLQRVERNKYELSLLDNSGNDKVAIEKLESNLKQEEEKLHALLSDSSNSGYVQKL